MARGYARFSVHLFMCAALTVWTVVESQRFIREPFDIAAREGTQVRIPCRVDLNSDYLEWLEYSTTYRGERIFLSFMNNANRAVDKSHPHGEKYAIKGSYDLVIKNVSFADAGIYRCRLVLAGIYRDSEIVVVTCPRCSGDIVIEEGHTVSVNCEMKYNRSLTSTKMPLLSWTRGRHSMTGSIIEGSHFVRHTISFVVREEDNGHVYTCNAHFRDNVPNYSASCKVTFNVQYAPRDISISPKSSYIATGQHIICEARANPTPTYTWQRISGFGPIRIEGPILHVTPDMIGYNRYRCLANNTIETIYRGGYSDIVFVVYAGSTPSPTPGVVVVNTGHHYDMYPSGGRALDYMTAQLILFLLLTMSFPYL